MSLEKIIASLPKRSADERKQMRHNAVEQLENPDPNKAAAAEQFLAALTDYEASEHAELIAEVAGLAPAARVIKAFTAEPMTETERKLIQVLLDNPDATSGELTEKIGWKGMSWHLHFGTMCAERGVYLGQAPDAVTRPGKFYTGVLADYDGETSGFTMKPDVAAAFEKLGLRGKCS
jgi:hypothetical protein